MATYEISREMYHAFISTRAIHAMAQSLQRFQRFFDGRYALGRLQQTVVPQAHHPLAFGDATDLTGRGPLQDHLPDLVAYHHHLVNPGPSPVAAPAAPPAAYGPVEVQAFSGQSERE